MPHSVRPPHKYGAPAYHFCASSGSARWRASTRSSCSRRTFPAATAPRWPSASSTPPRRSATRAPVGSRRRPSVVRMSALSARAVARSAQSSAQSAGPVATYPTLSQAMYPSGARTRSQSSRASSTSSTSPWSTSLTRGAATRGSPSSGASAAVTTAARATTPSGINCICSLSPVSPARRRNASRASRLVVTPTSRGAACCAPTFTESCAPPLGAIETSNTARRPSGAHLRRMSSTARSILSTPHRALHRLGYHEGGNRLDLHRGLRLHRGGADREDDVAVEQRSVRGDAARQRIAARLRERLQLHAVEIGIRRDHGERRIAIEPRGVAERRAALGEVAKTVDAAGNDLPARVSHIPDRIHHHQRADDYVAKPRRPGADAGRNHLLDSRSLAARGPATHADSAVRIVGGRVVARAVGVIRARPTQRLPSVAKIEDDGRWNDGNRPLIPNL